MRTSSFNTRLETSPFHVRKGIGQMHDAWVGPHKLKPRVSINSCVTFFMQGTILSIEAGQSLSLCQKDWSDLQPILQYYFHKISKELFITVAEQINISKTPQSKHVCMCMCTHAHTHARTHTHTQSYLHFLVIRIQ